MKVLLFGASTGGQNFIKNHAHEYEFLAVVDNDSKKHGFFLENIPVISVSQISDYAYEKVIVASMYVDSISKQLEAVGVNSKNIVYASKNSMKMNDLPFENKNILKKANLFIHKLSEVFAEIPHYFTFGTLLGIARDGRLIPWDDDIDLAIFADDVLKAKARLLENATVLSEIFDLKMYVRKYIDGKIASISIDCYEEKKKLFNLNLDCMYIDGNLVKQELNDTPIQYFRGYDQLQFEGSKIRVPKNYQGYLEYTYGDWRVVKKNTSFADNTLSFREPKFGCLNEYFYETK